MRKRIPWDLIESKLRHEQSVDEEIRFAAWLKKGNNQEMYNRLETIWQKIQDGVIDYEPDVEYYWQKISARIQRMEDMKGTVPASSKERHKRISMRTVGFPKVAAVAVAVLLGTFFIAFYLGKYNAGSQQFYTYSTNVSKMQVMLPDSTKVWLNSHSSLTYNYNTLAERRDVKLQGEAYFDVKHDERIPFSVSANGVDVVVHGTEFNVNSYTASGKVQVSLFNGSVSMEAADEVIFLKPGEEGVFDVESGTISVSEGDLDLAQVWTREQIRFENKNLREVCRYLSRWYGVDIRVDQDIDDNQLYAFTFRGQSLDDMVEALTAIHAFDYEIDEENNIVLIKKGGQ